MAQIRATLFFERGKYGFTETYFSNADDMGTALIQLDKLVSARTGPMLGNDYALIYSRLSDDLVQRDSLVQLNGYPIFGRSLSPGAEPWDTVLMRAASGANYRRGIYLRGIPNVLWGSNGVFNNDQNWGQAVEPYRQALVADGWGIKGATRTVGPLNAIVSINNTLSVIKTLAPHGLALGDVVKITRARPSDYQGLILKVTFIVGPDEVRCQFPLRRDPYRPFQTGDLQKLAYSIRVFTQVVTIRGITRKTGRPFGLSVGAHRRPR